jgi:hypothetical protein
VELLILLLVPKFIRVGEGLLREERVSLVICVACLLCPKLRQELSGIVQLNPVISVALFG